MAGAYVEMRFETMAAIRKYGRATLEHNKMKKLKPIFVGFLLIISNTAYTDASEIYWAEIPIRPNFIVVGTLKEVIKDAFVMPGLKAHDEYETRYVHDGGWIDVEKILYGDSVGIQLPISWHADTRLHPAPIDGGVIKCSGEKTHFVGERRIWVLWRRKRHGEKLSMYYMYYGFQDLPVDSLKRVKKDIKDIINEGIAD